MEQKTKIITDIRDWLQEAVYKYSGEDLVNAFELKFSGENIAPIEEEFRDEIHLFLLGRDSERKNSYSSLGFKDEMDLLTQVLDDTRVAIWALTEYLDWGLSQNYRKNTFLEEEDPEDPSNNIYCFVDSASRFRYFKVNYDLGTIAEVHRVEKKIIKTEWEEIGDI